MSLFPFRQTHLMSLHPREAGRWDPAPRPHRGPRTAPECSTRPAQQPGADSRLLVSLSSCFGVSLNLNCLPSADMVLITAPRGSCVSPGVGKRSLWGVT